jgi:hypothetical protein
MRRSKRSELLGIIADNLGEAGFSWGCVATMDHQGRTIWIADAHRDDGKRFVVRADDKLTAFLELESARRPVKTDIETHGAVRAVQARDLGGP